jgi:hypothetical protein
MEHAYKDELTKLHDADLLKLLDANTDNVIKLDAYWILYNRYEKLLWLQCQKVCKRSEYFDPNLPSIVFEKAMEQLFSKGHLIFKKRLVPPEEQGNVVLAYLGKAAKNFLIKHLSTYGEVIIHELPDDFNIEWMPAYEPPPDEYDDATDGIWKEALDKLKPVDRDILLTYAQHAGKDHRIPEEFRQSLKYEYNLTDDNLRKKHQRAINKLLNIISKKTYQNESKPRKRVAKNGKSPAKTPAAPGLSVLGNSPPGKRAKGGKPRREPSHLSGKPASHLQPDHEY